MVYWTRSVKTLSKRFAISEEEKIVSEGYGAVWRWSPLVFQHLDGLLELVGIFLRIEGLQ